MIFCKSGYRSTSLLDGFPLPVGKVIRVREASGWCRFTLTTISLHPLICVDVPFVEVIGNESVPKIIINN